MTATPAELARRRAAAHRCPPLSGGHRDPWTRDGLGLGAPSAYGLSEDALRAHARELHRLGWRLWEIRARLALPSRRDHPCPCRPHNEVTAA